MKLKCALFMTAPLFLVACGGGGGSTTTPVVEDKPDVSVSTRILANNRTTDMNTALDGQTITATLVDPGSDTQRPSYSITFMGETYLITNADFNSQSNQYEIIRTNGDEFYVWIDPSWTTQDRTVGGVFSVDASQDINYRSYAVFGELSPESVVESRANATYEGSLGMEIWDVNDSYRDTSEDYFIADVTLNANFENAKISGAIDDAWVDYDGGIYVADTFAINETDITASSFETNLTSTCEATNGCNITLQSSSFNGEFYGDTASEAGGGITIDGTLSSGTEITGIGFWAADEVAN